MFVSVALAALAAVPDLSAIVAIPRHADAALFVLALAGLVVGRRLSPRSEALARRNNDDA